jgi:hypothetical protein
MAYIAFERKGRDRQCDEEQIRRVLAT